MDGVYHPLGEIFHHFSLVHYVAIASLHPQTLFTVSHVIYYVFSVFFNVRCEIKVLLL